MPLGNWVGPVRMEPLAILVHLAFLVDLALLAR